jgi:protein gp37
MEFHEHSSLFPLLPEAELQTLADDIAVNGLREPITLLDGKVLDGRNRFRACEMVGVEPRFHYFNGDGDSLAYVLSANLHRRHLDTGQRAMVAEKLANMRQGERAAVVENSTSQAEAAELVGVGRDAAIKARKIRQRGAPEVAEAVEDGKLGLDAAVALTALPASDQARVLFAAKAEDNPKVLAAPAIKKRVREVKDAQRKRQLTKRPRLSEDEKEAKEARKLGYSTSEWEALSPEVREALSLPHTSDRETFNEQKSDLIGWALWSWNPITGCLHGCRYCYARDIAESFTHGFTPVIRPDRLSAPRLTAIPDEAKRDVRHKNVFTGSMADMFGKWVPQDWIDAVLAVMRDQAQWNYICLTKFPDRLAAQDWPSNAWVGATIDTQSRVEPTLRAFEKVRKQSNASFCFLSLEPLIEPLGFDSLALFDTVIIGGASPSRSYRTPRWTPPLRWVLDIMDRAERDGCRVHLKTDNMPHRWGAVQTLPDTKRAPDAFFAHLS